MHNQHAEDDAPPVRIRRKLGLVQMLSAEDDAPPVLFQMKSGLVQMLNAKDGALPVPFQMRLVLVQVHNAKDVEQGRIPQKWVLLWPISVPSVQLATAPQILDQPSVHVLWKNCLLLQSVVLLPGSSFLWWQHLSFTVVACAKATKETKPT